MNASRTPMAISNAQLAAMFMKQIETATPCTHELALLTAWTDARVRNATRAAAQSGRCPGPGRFSKSAPVSSRATTRRGKSVNCWQLLPDTVASARHLDAANASGATPQYNAEVMIRETSSQSLTKQLIGDASKHDDRVHPNATPFSCVGAIEIESSQIERIVSWCTSENFIAVPCDWHGIPVQFRKEGGVRPVFGVEFEPL